jgi:PAS domain S-box-containing protein
MTSEAKILIVEDEAITGMDIRRSLTEMGYSVCAVAPTGELAVKEAGELQPDLILMDIMLAGKMNGIEAAEQIQKQYRIPVVYLTAYSDDKFLAKARVTEPFGYILKPFRELELKTTIEMALYKYSMEEALRLSEETKRVMLNATADRVFLIDTRGRFLAVNRAMAESGGRQVDDFIGSDTGDLVKKGLLTPWMAGWNLDPLTRDQVHLEEESGGSWFDTVFFPVTDRRGKIVLYAVYIRDITRHKLAEEQTRQNEEFFRSLVENSSDVIMILNRDGTIRHESPSVSGRLGYEPDFLVKTDIFSLVPPDEVPALRVLLAEVVSHPGLVRPFTLKIRNSSGGISCMEGILSNLIGNAVIDGIVVNGWIRPFPA